jgi:hypothetical protein
MVVNHFQPLSETTGAGSNAYSGAAVRSFRRYSVLRREGGIRGIGCCPGAGAGLHQTYNLRYLFVQAAHYDENAWS